MRIGELANRTGVNVQTIRYYERVKLLKAPKRLMSGYRIYDFTDLERVTFIRQTQEFGFSLEEIQRLATAHSAVLESASKRKTDGPEMQLIVDMFEEKRRGVFGKIVDLQNLEERLRQGIDNLTKAVPQCPVGATKVAPNASCPHGQSSLKQDPCQA